MVCSLKEKSEIRSPQAEVIVY